MPSVSAARSAEIPPLSCSILLLLKEEHPRHLDGPPPPTPRWGGGLPMRSHRSPASRSPSFRRADRPSCPVLEVGPPALLFPTSRCPSSAPETRADVTVRLPCRAEALRGSSLTPFARPRSPRTHDHNLIDPVTMPTNSTTSFAISLARPSSPTDAHAPGALHVGSRSRTPPLLSLAIRTRHRCDLSFEHF